MLFSSIKSDSLQLGFENEQDRVLFQFCNMETSIPLNTRTIELTRTEDGKSIHSLNFRGSQTTVVGRQDDDTGESMRCSVPEDHQLLGIELFSTTDEKPVGLRVCSWRSPYRSDSRISNHERDFSETKLTPYRRGKTCKQSHWLYYQTEAKAT